MTDPTDTPESIETQPELEPASPPSFARRLTLPKTRWVLTSISPDGPLAIEVDATFDRKAPPPKFTAYKVAAVRKASGAPDAPIVVFPNPLQKAGMIGVFEFRIEECAYFAKVLKPLLDLLTDAYRSPGHQAPPKEEPKGPKLVKGTEADLKAIDAAAGVPRA